MTLLNVGRRLAGRLASATAVSEVRHRSNDLICDGQPALALEAPGLELMPDLGLRIDRYTIEDLELHSFLLPITGARPLRCYLISSHSQSPSVRRRVRELRIHVLRLHSIYQFMTGLINEVHRVGGPGGKFALEPSAPYDRLQYAISIFVRTLRRARVAGIGSTPNLLSAALLAHEFITDAGLEVLEQRLLAAVRPAILRNLRALAGEEKDRTKVNDILERRRNSDGILTIHEGELNVSNYDLRGANVGAAGDNASAANFIQGQVASVLKFGDQELDRLQLISELSTLREVIEHNKVSNSGDRPDETQAVLMQAQDAARVGDNSGVRANLAKVGQWVLRLAEATGSAVAAAAIKHALGL